MGTRILIADDHKIVREGLRTLLENQADIEVLGEAQDGRAAVRMAKEKRPDVVIMDVAMSSMNGIEATRQIVEESPGVRVLALSMHSDQRFVAQALQAGAVGYLLKDCAFEELTEAIETVTADRIYLSPEVTGGVVRDYVSRLSKTEAPALPALTSRQREVLQLIAEGKTTKEVAELLDISVKTVEAHRKKIKDKLDLHSIAELTKYAVRAGFTSLEA